MEGTIYPYVFGLTFLGSSGLSVSANIKHVSKFTLGSSADIYHLIVGCSLESLTAKIRGVIYSDNAGVPNALLGVTQENVGVTVGSNIFTFSPYVSLNSGDYWLGFISDSSVQFYLHGIAFGAQYNSDTYSDGPTDPFGTPTSNNYQRSVYATGESFPGTEVDKVLGYSVLTIPEGTVVSKLIAYAVLAPPNLVNPQLLIVT